MIRFNEWHDGITLEAVGEIVLTAARPAVLNRVVDFSEGVSMKTRSRRQTRPGTEALLRL